MMAAHATDAAWRHGRLDQRCLDCDATSAASCCCYACGSTRLAYRTHTQQDGLEGSYWCGARKPASASRSALRSVRLSLAGATEALAVVAEATGTGRAP